MFPPAGASVFRNEAGEVLGWDYPDEGPYDPDDYLAHDDYDDMDDDVEVAESDRLTWGPDDNIDNLSTR